MVINNPIPEYVQQFISKYQGADDWADLEDREMFPNLSIYRRL